MTYDKAPIKREGGVANPDEFEWECDCEQCRLNRATWKAAYEADQKENNK
jgi:hypothetical protein